MAFFQTQHKLFENFQLTITAYDGCGLNINGNIDNIKKGCGHINYKTIRIRKTRQRKKKRVSLNAIAQRRQRKKSRN